MTRRPVTRSASRARSSPRRRRFAGGGTIGADRLTPIHAPIRRDRRFHRDRPGTDMLNAKAVRPRRAARRLASDLHRQSRPAAGGGADLRDRPARRRRASISTSPAPFKPRLGAHRAQGRDRPSRPLRARGHAPLRAALAKELRDRYRALPARLLHHEAQSAPQRAHGAAARLRRHPPDAAALDRARRARADAGARRAGCSSSPAWRRWRFRPRPARMASSAA